MKKRRSEPQGAAAVAEEDRLSELPDSVIFLILWYVPMIDVVRTSILSKRWRNLWTTTPFLKFDENTFPILQHDSRRFRSFVNQFLFRWNGLRILKFRVSYEFDDVIRGEIEPWVKFAVDKGVEDLYLRNTLFDYKSRYNSEVLEILEKCWVPQCLYSCSSLKLLSITNCKFRVDESVKWDKLKKLTISLGYEVTKLVINRIMSGSPRLEAFMFTFVDEEQNLDIRTNSLKELSISKYANPPDEVSLVSELTVWAPNLETLKIEGVPFGKCRLINVPSSTHVTIGFSSLLLDLSDCCEDFAGIDLGNGLSFEDFLGQEFINVLQSIQHVKSVAIVCCCPEVLGAMTMKRCVYHNVKSLTIKRSNDYKQTVRLLEVFPRLSGLVLSRYVKCYFNENELFKSDAEIYNNFKACLPKSRVSQLKTIDITCCGEENMFPYIELLLKYGSKLEKMVFRSFTADLLAASQKLLGMTRSSPNCRIITTPYVEDCD